MLFGAYITPPQDPITINDISNTNVYGVYIGGMYVWLEDGRGPRTLYVVDNMYGWIRS
jgi:hypothetical protein